MPNPRDFYAANAIRSSQDILKLSQLRDIDIWARLKLAAGGYADDFLKARTRELYLQLAHDKSGKNLYQKQIASNYTKIAETMLSDLTDFSDISPWQDIRFPFFLTEFYFELASPVITRDEASHYPIENPIRKDYALKLPIIGSSGWKGLLRNAFLFARLFPSWNEHNKKKDEASKESYLYNRWQMLRLFGSEKEAAPNQKLHPSLDENAAGFKEFSIKKFTKSGEQPPGEIPNTAGCLYTYPTIFSNLEVELINPHDSVRRVGTQPIHLEMIPAGSTGLFRVFYLLNRPVMVRGEVINDAAKKDFEAMLKTIQLLFLELGISSKRTSGHGSVRNEFPQRKGRIVDNFSLPLSNGKIILREKQVEKFVDLENVVSEGGIGHE
ncbi:MAG: RAMP superfamily CRISPR-associated protein [bacterium]|nr:RAMP superfamily CRISPR-associated protein [bacterium]